MVKVVVWMSSSVSQPSTDKFLWSGTLSQVPRVGEAIYIDDVCETVLQNIYNLYGDFVTCIVTKTYPHPERKI